MNNKNNKNKNKITIQIKIKVKIINKNRVIKQKDNIINKDDKNMYYVQTPAFLSASFSIAFYIFSYLC